MLPRTLTEQELNHFNRFYQSLSPDDRAVFDDLLAKAAERNPAIGVADYLPYHAWLLSLLIEEHKEIQRLKSLLDDTEI